MRILKEKRREGSKTWTVTWTHLQNDCTDPRLLPTFFFFSVCLFISLSKEKSSTDLSTHLFLILFHPFPQNDRLCSNLPSSLFFLNQTYHRTFVRFFLQNLSPLVIFLSASVNILNLLGPRTDFTGHSRLDFTSSGYGGLELRQTRVNVLVWKGRSQLSSSGG